jgi:hypothetical protein
LNPDIGDYIRANRATYTPESIRQQLLDAGHEPEAIDAAWREIEQAEQGEHTEPTALAPVLPQRRAIATAQFWLLLLGTACVALTVVPTIVAFLLRTVSSAAISLGYRGANGGVALLIGTGVILILAYLAIGFGGWLLLRRDRAAGLGVLSGLATAFVLAVIVAGLCVALLQNL